jgi:hypothetical protein
VAPRPGPGRLAAVPGAPTAPNLAAGPARAAPRTPAGRPAPVRYQILVRPYGALQVDDERRSSEALSVHTRAHPGRHVLRVSCQWCEDQVVPIEVVAGKPRPWPSPPV